MSWTLDQYTTYGAKVVSVAEREATHTLDAIVHAQGPEIREHTTDTHGYTDIVFALFDLLGRRFLPRLRDLPDQRLYRLGPSRPRPRGRRRVTLDELLQLLAMALAERRDQRPARYPGAQRGEDRGNAGALAVPRVRVDDALQLRLALDVSPRSGTRGRRGRPARL